MFGFEILKKSNGEKIITMDPRTIRIEHMTDRQFRDFLKEATVILRELNDQAIREKARRENQHGQPSLSG